MACNKRGAGSITLARPLEFKALWSLAEALSEISRVAGNVVMKHYKSDFEVMLKDDQSPVTIADEESEAVILRALAELQSDLPIVAEEQVAACGYPDFDSNDFWLIDALDGTKEFINRRGDFTVNIGLIQDNVPSLGVVFAPVRNELYRGVICPRTGKQRAEVHRHNKISRIKTRKRPATGLTIVGSLSHQVKDQWDHFTGQYNVKDTISMGSSIKFCLVAEGAVDLYPRFSPTREWDTAAGHAVVRAAGGRVRTFEGDELRYHKPDFLNGTFVVEGMP